MQKTLTFWLFLSSAFLTTGCSGFFAEDYKTFKARIAAEYPVGSDVKAIEKGLRWRGFKPSGPALRTTPNHPDPLQDCLRKSMNFGIWASGYRYVCYEPTDGGQIAVIRTYEFVAGL